MNWSKDIVTWKVNNVLYISVVFSWHLIRAKKIAEVFKGKVIAGGPAVMYSGADWADEVQELTPFDVLSMHNPMATFTTRGCLRKCPFCIVPKIEGQFRELNNWKPAPIICDNNILVASKHHFEKVIDSVKCFPYVDFNQGLDARLFTSWHANQLCRLKKVKVRFAFDHINQERIVINAIEIARKAGLKDFNVYVLFGFNDTPEDAKYRLELVRSWKIWPNPMRYQPLDSVFKNSYVDKNWTDRQLKNITQYYGYLRYLEHIPFDEYEFDYHKIKEPVEFKERLF